jgi:arabinose-5-phosphate isomerase
MLIADYIMLTHRRFSVRPDTTGREIAYRLMSTGLPGLPVVKDDMEIIGIVTEFDLLGNIRERRDLNKITAEKIMSKEPKTANLETPAEKLIEMMLENNFTMIPIIKDKKLVGVVDRFSLIEAYVEPGLYRYLKEEK